MGTIVKVKTDKGERFRAQVRVMRGGVRVHQEGRTFSKRALAKEWLRRREMELETGGLPTAADKHADLTLTDGIGVYLDAVGDRFERSVVSTLKLLQRSSLGERRLLDLTSRDYIEHVAVRQASPTAPGPVTMNAELAMLRPVLRYLKHALGIPASVGELADAQETLRANRLIGKSRTRQRRPTYEELQALDALLWERWSTLPDTIPYWHIFWFALLSCRRLSEIARIPRSGLDREHGVYLIEGGLKHPRGRVRETVEATLPPDGWRLVDLILRDFPEGENLLDFPVKTISSRFPNLCRLMEVSDFHFHDLRHEGLSRLAEDGYTIPQLQQVSRHHTWASLSRYVNISPRRARRFTLADSAGFVRG